MNNYLAYWDNICEIYLLTKHYLLLSEELSEDFDTFFQPVKEHRDAFDHIVRVYGYKHLEKEPKNVEAYCNANMKKAIGHTYRAFFDTADWLSYICRKKIRELLQGKDRDCIIDAYPKYLESKAKLEKLPHKIARIRENKDVSDNPAELVAEVQKYKIILDDLLEMYAEISSIF